MMVSTTAITKVMSSSHIERHTRIRLTSGCRILLKWKVVVSLRSSGQVSACLFGYSTALDRTWSLAAIPTMDQVQLETWIYLIPLSIMAGGPLYRKQCQRTSPLKQKRWLSTYPEACTPLWISQKDQTKAGSKPCQQCHKTKDESTHLLPQRHISPDLDP